MRTPISIVLTSLNETERVADAVGKIIESCSSSSFRPCFVFVDDGSNAHNVASLRRLGQKVGAAIVVHAENNGRGKSVADGIRGAKTSIVGFIDPDLEIPARYIVPAAAAIANGADVVCGRRFYDVTMRDFVRILLSKGYVFLMRFMLGSRLSDTETGLKFFRRKAILPILSAVRDPRWFWDTEVMVRSERAGLRIVELPVVVVKRPEVATTVHLVRDTLYYLRSLLRFRKETFH